MVIREGFLYLEEPGGVIVKRFVTLLADELTYEEISTSPTSATPSSAASATNLNLSSSKLHQSSPSTQSSKPTQSSAQSTQPQSTTTQSATHASKATQTIHLVFTPFSTATISRHPDTATGLWPLQLAGVPHPHSPSLVLTALADAEHVAIEWAATINKAIRAQCSDYLSPYARIRGKRSQYFLRLDAETQQAVPVYVEMRDFELLLSGTFQGPVLERWGLKPPIKLKPMPVSACAGITFGAGRVLLLASESDKEYWTGLIAARIEEGVRGVPAGSSVTDGNTSNSNNSTNAKNNNGDKSKNDPNLGQGLGNKETIAARVNHFTGAAEANGKTGTEAAKLAKPSIPRRDTADIRTEVSQQAMIHSNNMNLNSNNNNNTNLNSNNNNNNKSMDRAAGSPDPTGGNHSDPSSGPRFVKLALVSEDHQSYGTLVFPAARYTTLTVGSIVAEISGRTRIPLEAVGLAAGQQQLTNPSALVSDFLPKGGTIVALDMRQVSPMMAQPVQLVHANETSLTASSSFSLRESTAASSSSLTASSSLKASSMEKSSSDPSGTHSDMHSNNHHNHSDQSNNHHNSSSSNDTSNSDRMHHSLANSLCSTVGSSASPGMSSMYKTAFEGISGEAGRLREAVQQLKGENDALAADLRRERSRRSTISTSSECFDKDDQTIAILQVRLAQAAMENNRLAEENRGLKSTCHDQKLFNEALENEVAELRSLNAVLIARMSRTSK